jgi:glucose/galactose transporter
MKWLQKAPPIFIIGALFFIFGFVTWLGSVLIPYLRIACGLTVVQSYLVAFSFYISYTVLAVPSSWILKKTGFKKGMSIGLFVMAFGSVLFIPAALYREYMIFLVGLFFQGAGLTLLQTASNPYITILGPKESAAKRISIMGICNGIAGVAGPIILGSVILKDADILMQRVETMSVLQKGVALKELSMRVIGPYSIMVVSLLSLALMINYSSLPNINEDPEMTGSLSSGKPRNSIWQFPYLLVGVSTLFFYVGVEVIAVDTVAGYAQSQGISLQKAAFFASFTLLNMLAGYIIGIICIPKFISQQKALLFSATAGLLFIAMALLTHGIASVCFISLLGLSNALIWPSIWPLAIDGLGKFTKTGASLLIMAIGGGAILPLLYGRLVESFGNHDSYLIVVPCYSMILFYAAYGHKLGKHENKNLM